MDPVITVRLTAWSPEYIVLTALTDRLGLVPARLWAKGDPRVLRNGHVLPQPRAESGWQLQLGPRKTIDLPAMLVELLDAIDAADHDLKAVASELALDIEVSAHVYMADQAPIGTLDQAVIQRLAGLDASFDIDLYVVDDDFTEAV